MGRSNLAGALVLSVLTASCLHDSTGPGSSRYGRYTLQSINGQPLPGMMLQSSTATLEFVAGVLRLNHDFSFTDSTKLRVVALKGGDIRNVIDVAAGSFRFAGDTVHLSSTRGEQYHMIFQVAGSLTQELNGRRLVYRK